MDSKEAREGNWSRKFSSATYVKGLIEEVAAPVVGVEAPVLDQNDGVDDSFGSSISEGDADAAQAQAIAPAPASAMAPVPAQARASGPPSRKLLKGKIQAGVQKRVDDFWKRK